MYIEIQNFLLQAVCRETQIPNLQILTAYTSKQKYQDPHYRLFWCGKKTQKTSFTEIFLLLFILWY